MNWAWSDHSKEVLKSCHPLLQAVMTRALVLSPFDLRLLEGHRDQETQNRLYFEGRSKLRWPHSKHNEFPSLAVDVIPLPVDWENMFHFHVMAGVIFAAAIEEGISAQGWQLRTGQDWDGDWSNKDQRFHDAPHFELVKRGG